ncbi:MAG: curli production assembly protein CsgG [Acidobacteriota bacterium]|nr:curli production assembly protein CsgG [Acidobacteriota bacterium]
MKKIVLIFLSVFIFASLCPAQQKKRVAVLNFDYGTVQTYVDSIFGANQDVGKGISDMLVNQLVQSGKYVVVERNAIDKVISEQNFSNSYRADPATAAKIGRLLGVSDIILGSVNQFGRDDQTRTIGGGALGGLSRRYGIGGIQRRKSKAVVGLSARVIDVDTGQILAVAEGKGESTRSGESLLGAGGGGGSAGGGAYDMSGSNFANTILGEAVHEAVNNLAARLDQEAGTLPVTTRTINGLVADASGNPLILNVGSQAGVRVGDQLGVYRKVRDIKDPVSGKVIKTIEDKIGEVKITEVDALSSEGQFSGSTPAKIGDIVKNSE